MKKLYEVNGTYGSQNTPCTVFVAENWNGSKWYAAEGATNVNLTRNSIEEGDSIEELKDIDVFTTSKPINSLDDLEKAVLS